MAASSPLSRRIARTAGKLKARQFLLELAMQGGDKARARAHRQALARAASKLVAWSEWHPLAAQYVAELNLSVKGN